MLAYLRLKLGSKPKRAAQEAHQIEQKAAMGFSILTQDPSEAAEKNYLEDLALTQTMFENGTLIMQ